MIGQLVKQTAGGLTAVYLHFGVIRLTRYNAPPVLSYLLLLYYEQRMLRVPLNHSQFRCAQRVLPSSSAMLLAWSQNNSRLKFPPDVPFTVSPPQSLLPCYVHMYRSSESAISALVASKMHTPHSPEDANDGLIRGL